MLTRELAIAEYEGGQVIPDRLTQKRHAHYVGLIRQSLEIYRHGMGRMRRDLHRDVHEVFADELECPIRRIDAFCKLLDEKSSFDSDRRGKAAQLRHDVFRLAGPHHPLVQEPDRMFESGESMVKQEIGRQLGKSWPEIERELFADLIPFHRLSAFEGYENEAALLARYNVAQCQAVLYDAVSMTVWANRDFKTILRYAKLARLMHSIERQSNGSYIFHLDGPSSMIRQSRRYGVALAKFLPALIACHGWKMQARILHRRSSWKNYFRLSSADGLRTHHPGPDLFDSTLEENFARRWGADPREGWSLIREDEVLHVDQKVFVPDFVFQHESGVRVLMEIVGFWTPEYLSAKLATLHRFRDHAIMVAVSDQIDWPDEVPGLDWDASENANVIRYKSSIRISEVMSQLQSRLPRRP